MLALGCAVHLDTYRLAGALADHMFMAIAGVLGAVPLIFFIWGNLQGKRDSKAEAAKATLDVADAARGGSPGSSGPADAARLEPEPEAPAERRRRSGAQMERRRPPTAEDTALYMDGFRDLGSRPPGCVCGKFPCACGFLQNPAGAGDPDAAPGKVRGGHNCAAWPGGTVHRERAAAGHSSTARLAKRVSKKQTCSKVGRRRRF
jgi:hypothetical protein